MFNIIWFLWWLNDGNIYTHTHTQHITKRIIHIISTTTTKKNIGLSTYINSSRINYVPHDIEQRHSKACYNRTENIMKIIKKQNRKITNTPLAKFKPTCNCTTMDKCPLNSNCLHNKEISIAKVYLADSKI